MKTIIEVPMTDLTINGEDGGAVTPEQGDLVTVTTPGRFVEQVGDKGRVEIGPDDQEDAGEPDEAGMEKELQGMYEGSQKIGGMME
jgi:hypothetical protein